MATAFPYHPFYPQERRSSTPGGSGGGVDGTRVRRTRGERNRRSGQRETLLKEVARERMLRAEAEQRLSDMTLETDTTKQRLQSLQNEFKKMEELVRSMVSYKHKIDALKQEKSHLITSYEASVAKYQTHVKNLDRENRMLLAEMKRLESSQTPAGRGPEEAESKTKVLLERLKILEGENSSLVLENETQRQQYEKCLDSIANQVVQALLTQKGLREECGKLQLRVVDLEHQNRQLNHMFQQRMRFASDSAIQAALSKVATGTGNTVSTGSGSGNGSRECRSPGSSGGSYTSLSLQQQLTTLNEMTSDGGSLSRPGGEQAASACSFDSIFSLHSICSDYNDHSQCEDGLGKPEMSSPPPWLREKVNFPFSDHGSSDSSERGPAAFTTDCEQTIPKTIVESNYKMETEFPANNASPKSRHVLCEKRVSSPAGSNPEAVSALRACVKSFTETAVKVCGDSAEKEGACGFGDGGSPTHHPVKDGSSHDKHPGSPVKEALRKTPVKLVRCMSCEQRPTAEDVPCMACASENTLSPGQELLKLADSFNEKFVVTDKDGLPQIINKMMDTSSDDDTSPRPISHTYSAASTVSLNELLERELDEMDTPNDEFSFDNLPIYSSVSAQLVQQAIATIQPELGITIANQEPLEDPVRDVDPDRAASKLSKSSSQSDSSILSQRPMRATEPVTGVVVNGCLSSESSPGLRRPTSLALSQDRLINTSDSEVEDCSEKSTPSSDSIRSKTKKQGTSPCKAKFKSISQDLSPKHKLHNQTSKSKSAKNLSSKEHHPLKLYNVLSPPGMHEGVLEKFKKVPPKVKPKPSIAMCLKVNSKEDQDDGPLRPTCKRPEVDGRESSPHDKQQPIIEMDSTKLRKPKNDLAGTIGVQESMDSVDPMTSSSSSGSPDSAMQQSFSSSSSDNTLSDKPSCRDDGYLSNSTISMSSNDIPGELHSGSNIKRRLQTHQPELQQFRRRSQPQASSDVHCLDNTSINPNNRKSKSPEEYADKCKSLPAGLKLGPGCHDSVSNKVNSASSTEHRPIGRVRDIKAFFEGKVEEKLRGHLSSVEKIDMPTSCTAGARPRTVGRCMEQDVHRVTRSHSEDEKSPRSSSRGVGPPVAPRMTQSWQSEDGLLNTKVPRVAVWQHQHQQQQQQKQCHHKVESTGCQARKTRRPRLRRCWSDTTINRCTSDIRRDENKSLHAALRHDWSRFCGALTDHARACSLPLTKIHSQRKRSVSPRLLPRRSQRSHRSQESIRCNGEGAETRLSPLGRPDAVGCASHQMAASYPSESSNYIHWGRHRRVTSSDKNLLTWSSDSDTGEDGAAHAPSTRGGQVGPREGPSPALPEWKQAQLPRQALGIRRLERTNFSDNKPRLSSCQLIPLEGRPEAISPTGPQVAPPLLHARIHKVAPPEKPPRRNQIMPEVTSRGQPEANGEGHGVSSANDHQGRLSSGLIHQGTLSSSLAEFEREYAEMCKKPEEMCVTGTLQDWSSAMIIKAKGASVVQSETLSTLSSPPSDHAYDSRLPDSSSQCQPISLSDEHNYKLSTNSSDGDSQPTDSTIVMQSISDKSIVCTSDCSEAVDSNNVEAKRLFPWAKEEEEESDSDLSTDSSPQFLTAEERAEMLDTLVTGGFSSSGGEEDVYLPSPTSPSRQTDAAVADRLRDLPDGKQKVRVTPQVRPSVDHKTFIRYSNIEQKAIASFGFLEDLSSAQSSGASSTEEEDQRAKHRSQLSSSLHAHTTTDTLQQQPPTKEPSSNKQQPRKQQSTKQQPSKQPTTKQQPSKQPTCKVPSSSAGTSRSVADGAAAPAGNERTKGRLIIRSAEVGVDKGRPANRTVMALRDESRINRLSNSSFEMASFGTGDLSLSDSCCEDFATCSDTDSKA